MRANLTWLILLLGVLTIGVTAVSQAQPQIQPETRLVVVNPPRQLIDGSRSDAASIHPLANSGLPLAFVADEPADTCEEPPLLILTQEFPADGNASNMSGFSESADDPAFSCLWGNPSRPQGYRTGWYKLAAPFDGTVVFDTFQSEFDTILGIYTGECGNLTEFRCQDDANAFTSEVSVPVTAGNLYYIEIADWQQGIVNTANLQFSAVLQPVDSRWEQILTNPSVPAISRHATVAYGPDFYIIGGQNTFGQSPQISNKLLRYNVSNGIWTELASIPGAGYANTTAARLGNTIFLPSGYNGADTYDGIHWAYDIPGDAWTQVAGIPAAMLPEGKPFAWAAAAVPPNQSRYFLTGGINAEPFDPDIQVNNTVFAYDPTANIWIPQTPMSAARYAHTAGFVGGKICTAGGISTGNVLIPTGECKAPSSNTWTTTGQMVVPRYGAGSAVGPDGRWYVFGGFNALGIEVATTEYYDPTTNSWQALEVSANLGNRQDILPRAYPRGNFFGNYLWVIGGSIFDEGEFAMPVMERLYIPTTQSFLPYLTGNYEDWLIPDDTFAQARGIGFNIPQVRNFDAQRDFYDFYTFEIHEPRTVNISLDVPNNNDFDLTLYGVNKLLWGQSATPLNGADENINLNLGARRYYIGVSRAFPTGQPDKNANYTILIE